MSEMTPEKLRKWQKKDTSNGIRWPKTKSLKELHRMSSKELLRYALRLHKAWAKKHEKDMQWDLFWVGFYEAALAKEMPPDR